MPDADDGDADLGDDPAADDEDDGPSAARVEAADGHRVFRLCSVAAFCDEADRLARAPAAGDLERAAADDPAAP
jgi:hypothetical protein